MGDLADDSNAVRIWNRICSGTRNKFSVIDVSALVFYNNFELLGLLFHFIILIVIVTFSREYNRNSATVLFCS